MGAYRALRQDELTPAPKTCGPGLIPCRLRLRHASSECFGGPHVCPSYLPPLENYPVDFSASGKWFCDASVSASASGPVEGRLPAPQALALMRWLFAGTNWERVLERAQLPAQFLKAWASYCKAHVGTTALPLPWAKDCPAAKMGPSPKTLEKACGLYDRRDDPLGVKDRLPRSKTLEKALQFRDDRDYRAAKIELEKVVRGDTGDCEPNRQLAEFRLCQVLHDLHWFPDAVSCFDRILQKGDSYFFYQDTLSRLAHESRPSRYPHSPAQVVIEWLEGPPASLGSDDERVVVQRWRQVAPWLSARCMVSARRSGN